MYDTLFYMMRGTALAMTLRARQLQASRQGASSAELRTPPRPIKKMCSAREICRSADRLILLSFHVCSVPSLLVRGYPHNGMVSPWRAGPTHSVLMATGS